jgi:dolichol-phosphate mannosyltransferase
MSEVTVVTPTYCEAENLPVLFARLTAALAGIDWELIVVDDDSPDGTADVAREMAQRDPHLRVVQRLHRRGLAGAVVEGMLASSAPIIAVIDADLQHDEAALPRMIDVLRRRPDVQLVVGSRYAEGGGFGDWGMERQRGSRLATRLGNLVCRTEVKDPMSGFFAIRRSAFMEVAHDLSDQGFKILLDILASARGALNVAEVPYQFRSRQLGESKLDSSVIWQYVELLLDKSIGSIIPVRMVKFALVGGSGLVIHMTTLFSSFKLMNESFISSQITATLVAMTWNYFLNNMFTFKDRRQHGWSVLWGLLSFYLVCSVGAFANVGIASYVYHRDAVWWVAGIAGVLVGTVWNYAVSSKVTWGWRKRAKAAQQRVEAQRAQTAAKLPA